MTAPSKRLLAGVVALLVLLTVVVVMQSSNSGTRRVTAYFDRTVSLYKGSEVRVMGVNIGTVTAVVPEGDRVRVAMEYDDEYKLPADAKAAIVTPTLTADRFVQIAPAYTDGPQLEDNAKIDLPDTGTPVELDRIYKSLSDKQSTSTHSPRQVTLHSPQGWSYTGTSIEEGVRLFSLFTTRSSET